jgi:ATP-dependent RNA helicase RhlE
MPFATLGLSPALLRAVAAQGYVAPTPIQTAVIGPALQGRDICGTAQTGSGKTAAFALPILQNTLQKTLQKTSQKISPLANSKTRLITSLILVPTRELAAQVGETLRALAAHLPHPPQQASALKITTVFGGVSINPQMLGLRGGTDIVVATPGRLLDLIDHNAITLNHVQMLVLDEADRLLDLGFADELQRILSLIPAARQSLFFSATFPPAVERLAQTLLRDPLRVAIANAPQTQPDIEQRAILVDAPKRTQLLRHLITQHRWPRVLVFVATQHAADIVAEKLRKARINAEPFHGDLSQGKRTQVLADFKASRLTVVVATDVAARGLDISALPVVVNFDLPRSTVTYTHRMGRTGRAGESGLAISFVSAATEAHFWLIKKRHGVALPLEIIDGFEPVEVAPPQPQGIDVNGGIKGKRPNKKDRLRALAASSV